MVWGSYPQQGQEISPFSGNVGTGSGAHRVSLFKGYRVLSRELSDGGVMLTIHLYRVTRLRMCGVIPLLPHYAFVVWVRKTPLLTADIR
jgi:hypothetical protein